MRNIFFSLVLLAYVSTGAAHAWQAPQSSDKVLQQARDLVARNQLEKANELLSDLVRTDPADFDAILELGKIQLAQGLNDDALKSFEIFLGHQPNATAAQEGEVKAATAAALADARVGDDDGALLFLIRGKKFVPNSPEILTNFGIQADRMHIYKDADEALTKAHTLAPDNSKILYALAHVQLDEQKMPEAEANLRAYLKMHPDDATAHYGLGRLLHMLVRTDEAKSELERSIALQSGQSESYYELGEIALELHQNAEAKMQYEKVLAAAPYHSGALTGMGILAYWSKDYPSAEKYLRAATLYAPDYPKAHQYYAMTLAKLGRQAESARESELASQSAAKQSKISRGYSLTILP